MTYSPRHNKKRQLQRAYEAGEMSLSEIAREFNVTERQVTRACQSLPRRCKNRAKPTELSTILGQVHELRLKHVTWRQIASQFGYANPSSLLALYRKHHPNPIKVTTSYWTWADKKQPGYCRPFVAPKGF